jgi:hypothetical protein
MCLIQKFDNKLCAKINCSRLWVHHNISVCYGNPEECRYNNKNGYPKEVKGMK